MNKKYYLPFLLIIILEVCASPLEKDNPYVTAINERINREDAISLIINQSQHQNFNNKRIKATGYIDFEHSRLYNNVEFKHDPSSSKVDYGLSLFLDFGKDNLTPLNCPESMVMVEGLYQYKNPEYDYLHVITDISVIEYYDTTPYSKGGRGELFLCYSQ